MDNPYEQRVIDLEAQVNALREEIRAKEHLRDVAYARQQNWGNAGQWGAPQYIEATNDYESALRALEVMRPRLNELLTELESARTNRDRIAQATANAVAQGLSPEAALAKAVGEEKRKKILTIATVIVVLAVSIIVILRVAKAIKKK